MRCAQGLLWKVTGMAWSVNSTAKETSIPRALATPGQPGITTMRRASIHNPAQRRSWKPGALLLLCRRFASEDCNVSCMETHGKAELQFITSTRRFAGSLLHCTK
ncbi:hypothetical protein TcCL_NonESM11282 [Trypanosoma cruzi]|nr:hypothetical protein TcCL_NonESM11282 [Trypanosoma cruzi]